MIDSKITWIDATTALPYPCDDKGKWVWFLAVWRNAKGGYGPVLLCARLGAEPDAKWVTADGVDKTTKPAYWARLPTTEGLLEQARRERDEWQRGNDLLSNQYTRQADRIAQLEKAVEAADRLARAVDYECFLHDPGGMSNVYHDYREARAALDAAKDTDSGPGSAGAAKGNPAAGAPSETPSYRHPLSPAPVIQPTNGPIEEPVNDVLLNEMKRQTCNQEREIVATERNVQALERIAAAVVAMVGVRLQPIEPLRAEIAELRECLAWLLRKALFTPGSADGSSAVTRANRLEQAQRKGGE